MAAIIRKVCKLHKLFGIRSLLVLTTILLTGISYVLSYHILYPQQTQFHAALNKDLQSIGQLQNLGNRLQKINSDTMIMIQDQKSDFLRDPIHEKLHATADELEDLIYDIRTYFHRNEDTTKIDNTLIEAIRSYRQNILKLDKIIDKENSAAVSFSFTILEGDITNIGNQIKIIVSDTDIRAGERSNVAMLQVRYATQAIVIYNGTINLLIMITFIYFINRRTKLTVKNQYLEEEVGKRIAAFEEAKIQAEQATKAKSEFLAAMSHEIRTPMNGVMSMVELISQSNLSQEQQAYADTVLESSRSLLTIINDILDFSKIEAGKFELEKHTFSLFSLIEGVVDLLTPKAEENGLNLISYVDPSISYANSLIGDSTRIRQILVNLIGNAIKFTEYGHVIVKVEQQDDKIMFRITDTGIGISEEHRERLFKPFEQADNSTSRKYGGTGLGLSISHTLVGIMGGEMGVESELNVGSTFWFTIPHDYDTDSEVHTSFLENVKVLVLSPNEEIRNLLDKYLTYNNITVTTTATASECYDAYGTSIINGAIYNILLIDGFKEQMELEAVGDLMKNNSHDLKLILIDSPSANIGNKHTAFIPKPVHYKQLCKTIAIVLGIEVAEEAIVADRKQLLNYTAPSVEEAIENDALILMAEDNKTNRLVAQKLMEKLGYVTEIVDDGLEALEKLKTQKYGLLITDCHMPNMDGYELTKEIRKLEAGSETHIPIIALTGDALVGTSERCIKHGMDDYLTKPISIPDMDRMIQKWLPRAAEIRVKHESEPEQPGVVTSYTNNSSIVDVAIIEDIFGSINSEVHEILKEFVPYARDELLAEIIACSEADDIRNAALASHKLGGAAKAVGAMKLGETCYDIEKQVIMCTRAYNGEIANVKERINGLSAMLDEADKEFQKIYQQPAISE